jgi:hypothetical protein
MATIVDWDGREIPGELRSLPPGRYVIERVDDVPQLTDAEAAGLDAAVASLRRGEGIEKDEVRRRLDAALKR